MRKVRIINGSLVAIVVLGSAIMGLILSNKRDGQSQVAPTFLPSSTPCPIDWIKIEPIILMYLDSTVTSASSLAINGPYSLNIRVFSTGFSMAQAESDFEAISLPDCANNIRADIVSGMNKGIDGFTHDPNDACDNFSKASQNLNSAYEQLLREGIQADERLQDMSLIWGCDSPIEK